MMTGGVPAVPAPPDWQARGRQLHARLVQEGVPVRVEAREAMAIVIAAEDAWPADPARRRAIVRAALEVGFTHVAVERERLHGAPPHADDPPTAPGEASPPGDRPA